MKVRSPKDHAKPSLKQNSDHFVLHVGTNDLDSDRSPKLISKSITDIAITPRIEKHDVTVSNVIPQSGHLQTKAKDVNTYLIRLSKENFFSLIDHWKRI